MKEDFKPGEREREEAGSFMCACKASRTEAMIGRIGWYCTEVCSSASLPGTKVQYFEGLVITRSHWLLSATSVEVINFLELRGQATQISAVVRELAVVMYLRPLLATRRGTNKVL